MTTETPHEIIPYDFRQTEQYISKPQPNDDNDDYEETDN
jgi:hypothetical protein